MKTKIFTLMLCIAAMGLATSCSKENSNESSNGSSSNNSTIVGKWECNYCASHSIRYGENGVIESESNSDHPGEIGKVWEFTADGDFFMTGVERMQYTISGNTLSFTINGSEASENFNIDELKSDFLSLTSVFDDRSSNGAGEYSTRTYQFRKKQ